MKRQIELYVREGDENTGNYQRIDLFDFEDINYTTRVNDIRNIAKVLTDFTHSFTIPASKVNNNLFKHYNKFEILNGFDARYKRDAIIKINGVDYRRGQISLNKTNSKKGNIYSYSLTFYGKVVSLNQLFGNDELESLYGVGTCLDDFNHELDGDYVSKGLGEGYNYDESTNSTSRNFNLVHSGDYCFPFISADDYHYYDSNDGPSPKNGSNLSRNIHPTATYNASINQYTGVRAFALKPAIKVKWIIKAIEQKYDINFSNHFFNNSNVKEIEDLMLWMNREKGRIDEQVGVSTTEFTIDDFTFVSVVPNTLSDFVVNGNQLAPTGSQSGDYRYIIDFTITPNNNDGLYSWEAKDALTNDGFGGQNDVTGTQTVSCTFQNNGNVMPQIEIQTNGGITAATFSNLEIRRERYEYDGNTGGIQFQWEPAGIASYTFNNPSVIFSAGINIGRNLPKMKVTTFLQTLFKMFNLTAYFEYTSDEIHVDTMDSFYEDGNTFDISDKIDYNKSETKKALLYNKIDFKFKGDKTFAKIASDDITNDDFGDELIDHNSAAVDSPLAFDGNKDYKVELPLEKMMFERMTDQDDQTVVTDVQWGWMANDNQQAIKGQALLFYPHKVYGATEIKFSLVDGGSSVLKTQYIIPTNCVNVDDDTSQSLHWGSEFNEYSGNELENSLFTTYYQKYISDIYNIQTRLVKVTAMLDTNLILNLRPNDSVIINNRSYRINKWESNLTTGKTEFELLNNIDNSITTTSGESSGGGSTPDTTSPTITISSTDVADGGNTESASLEMLFTVSEYTATFEIGDITTVNGSVRNFAVLGNNQFSVDFEPNGNGTCSISVAASQFTDTVGNDNDASNTYSFTKSTSSATGPTQSITSFSVAEGGSTGNGSTVITLTPSETIAPVSFTTADIEVTNGVVSNLSNPVGQLWSYTITPNGSGLVTTKVPADAWDGQTSGEGCQESNTFTYTKI